MPRQEPGFKSRHSHRKNVCMATINELKREIEYIKERNRKVESDKAWETSYSRRAILMIFTYAAIGLYLNALGLQKAWLSAIVPSIGFMLSTLTVPFFKKLWIKYLYRSRKR